MPMLLGFTPAIAATSLLVLPSTTSFSTWRSRGLRTSSAAGLGVLFIDGAPPGNLKAPVYKVKPFFDFWPKETAPPALGEGQAGPSRARLCAVKGHNSRALQACLS